MSLLNLLGGDAHQTAQQQQRQAQQICQQEHFKNNLTPEEYENFIMIVSKYKNKQITKEQYDSFMKGLLQRYPFPPNFTQMIKQRMLTLQSGVVQTLQSQQQQLAGLPIQQPLNTPLPVQQNQQNQSTAPKQSLRELLIVYKALPREEKGAFVSQHPDLEAFLRNIQNKNAQQTQPPAQQQPTLQQPPQPQANKPPPTSQSPPQPKQAGGMMAAIGQQTSLMGNQQVMPQQQDFFRQANLMYPTPSTSATTTITNAKSTTVLNSTT
ncbi:hypothetical protein AKO1_012446 [Acrasis kona]|uniref:Uncharacterized protein n=1 Tax=Acrasis kona TaxID=1008807 RepID=A0AAW2YXV0_9EUKA